MKKGLLSLLTASLLLTFASPLFAEGASSRKDVAIFATGVNPGVSIGSDVLTRVDQKIIAVFAGMGRFNVISQAARLSTKDVAVFIKAIKSYKEDNFVMPPEFAYGEKALTVADFNKMVGAFFVAIPVVTSYDAGWDGQYSNYEAKLELEITFINAADDTTYGVAHVSVSGSDKKSESKAIAAMVKNLQDGIESEIRNIPIFQLSSQILAVNGAEVKIQLGQDLGIKPGYEFAPLSSQTYGGVTDTEEAGLIGIKSVSSSVSTGVVYWSDVPLKPGVPLKEVPRAGVDLFLSPMFLTDGSFLGANMRFVSTGSSIDARFCFGLFSIFTDPGVPSAMYFGYEYNLILGKLSLTPWAGVGVGLTMSNALGASGYSFGEVFAAYGLLTAIGGLDANYYLNRDTKLHLEGGLIGYYYLAGGTF